MRGARLTVGGGGEIPEIDAALDALWARTQPIPTEIRLDVAQVTGARARGAAARQRRWVLHQWSAQVRRVWRKGPAK